RRAADQPATYPARPAGGASFRRSGGGRGFHRRNAPVARPFAVRCSGRARPGRAVSRSLVLPHRRRRPPYRLRDRATAARGRNDRQAVSRKAGRAGRSARSGLRLRPRPARGPACRAAGTRERRAGRPARRGQGDRFPDRPAGGAFRLAPCPVVPGPGHAHPRSRRRCRAGTARPGDQDRVRAAPGRRGPAPAAAHDGEARAHRCDGASAGRAAPALPLAPRAARRHPRRRAGTHRDGMVEEPEPAADTRLFPRRGRGRPPLLALSRRALRPRTVQSALVCARTLRMTKETAPHILQNQPPYAEIAVTSNFSFLRGASRPEELMATACLYGYAAIGIADRNTLAGVVRAYAAFDSAELPAPKPKFLVCTRLVFADATPDILVYPADRAAYGRLCRLLTTGKLRARKGECTLHLDDLLEWQEGLLLAAMPPFRG